MFAKNLISQYRLDLISRCGWRNVLEETGDLPAIGSELKVIPTVSLDVSGQFRDPIRLIRLRHPSVNWAPVPEAAVYKNGQALLRENNVWANPALFKLDPQIFSKSEPSAMQLRSQSELRLRVRAPIGTHRVRGLGAGGRRSGEQRLVIILKEEERLCFLRRSELRIVGDFRAGSTCAHRRCRMIADPRPVIVRQVCTAVCRCPELRSVRTWTKVRQGDRRTLARLAGAQENSIGAARWRRNGALLEAANLERPITAQSATSR